MNEEDNMQQQHAHKPEDEVLPPGSTRSFNWFLSRIDDGALVHELTQHLTEIGAALNQHYKDYNGKPKAKLTITIDFMNKKGLIEVEGSYDVKLPKRPKSVAIFWTDGANNFCDEDPKQMRLFPRTPRAV